MKGLLDLLNISNFFLLDHGLLKTKIICFLFETIKNDLISRKVFERFVTILTLSVNIIGVCLFSYSQYLRNFTVSLKVSSLKNEKYLNCTLIQYMHLFTPNYPLQHAKRLVTSLQGKLQYRCVV